MILTRWYGYFGIMLGLTPVYLYLSCQVRHIADLTYIFTAFIRKGVIEKKLTYYHRVGMVITTVNWALSRHNYTNSESVSNNLINKMECHLGNFINVCGVKI